MEKVNIAEKLALITDHWNPRVAAELNGQQIRLVKIKGELAYHKHPGEDEMFLVLEGDLRLDFQDRIVDVHKGEFMVVPRGVLHRPIAEDEVALLMFVTKENVNTGDVVNDMTLDTKNLDRI
jgi:mannose-6-phosphate isomerase-like protein (cupin superfamily)